MKIPKRLKTKLVSMIKKQQSIGAIIELRNATNIGLGEAKQQIDDLRASLANPKECKLKTNPQRRFDFTIQVLVEPSKTPSVEISEKIRKSLNDLYTSGTLLGGVAEVQAVQIFGDQVPIGKPDWRMPTRKR